MAPSKANAGKKKAGKGLSIVLPAVLGGTTVLAGVGVGLFMYLRKNKKGAASTIKSSSRTATSPKARTHKPAGSPMVQKSASKSARTARPVGDKASGQIQATETPSTTQPAPSTTPVVQGTVKETATVVDAASPSQVASIATPASQPAPSQAPRAQPASQVATSPAAEQPAPVAAAPAVSEKPTPQASAPAASAKAPVEVNKEAALEPAVPEPVPAPIVPATTVPAPVVPATTAPAASAAPAPPPVLAPEPVVEAAPAPAASAAPAPPVLAPEPVVEAAPAPAASAAPAPPVPAPEPVVEAAPTPATAPVVEQAPAQTEAAPTAPEPEPAPAPEVEKPAAAETSASTSAVEVPAVTEPEPATEPASQASGKAQDAAAAAVVVEQEEVEAEDEIIHAPPPEAEVSPVQATREQDTGAVEAAEATTAEETADEEAPEQELAPVYVRKEIKFELPVVDVEEVKAGMVNPFANQGDKENLPLTTPEAEGEGLLGTATRLWNIQGKRPAALKAVKQAVDTLEGCSARPELIAEAYATLADMHFASQQNDAAQVAVRKAMDAAEQAGQYALAIKLSNNLGAVMKKQEGPKEELLALYEKWWQVGAQKLGVSHPYAQMARSNVVDTLEDMGRVEDARQLLLKSLAHLKAEEELRMQQLRAEGGDPDAPFDRTQQAAADAERAEQQASQGEGDAEVSDGDAAQQQDSIEQLEPAKGESKTAAALRLTRTSLIRGFMEAGRLESKFQEYDMAEFLYQQALDLCESVYGKGSAETGSPVYALASCHKAAGRTIESKAMFQQLYAMTVETQGAASENAVGVARQLFEICQESGLHQESVGYAMAMLEGMQKLLGVKVHPYLEPYYNIACNAKALAGDMAGAEALKRQFLKGLAQMGAAHQRGAGARAPAAAGPQGKAAKGKGGKRK